MTARCTDERCRHSWTCCCPDCRGRLLRIVSHAATVLTLLTITAGCCDAAESVGISTHTLDVAQVERYASVGFRVVRVDLPWSHVVHHDGEHWGPFDALVSALRARGITPLLILQWDREDHVSEPAALAEFVRFAGVAGARYGGSIFEVLNEPNLHGEAWPYVSPEDYKRVASAVGAAIRAQPSSQRSMVIGPGLGGGTFDSEWLRRAFDAGLLDQVDALSVHPYAAGSPEGAPAYYDQVRALMGGDERPIVVSEWGFLASEPEQAALLARAIQVNAAYGIGLTVLYRWADLPGHEFGLVRQDGTEKLAAAVVRALLTGARQSVPPACVPHLGIGDLPLRGCFIFAKYGEPDCGPSPTWSVSDGRALTYWALHPLGEIAGPHAGIVNPGPEVGEFTVTATNSAGFSAVLALTVDVDGGACRLQEAVR